MASLTASVHGHLTLPLPSEHLHMPPGAEGRLWYGSTYLGFYDQKATFQFLEGAGVTTIWTLLEAHDDTVVVERERFHVIHSPVEDFSVPTDREAFERDARRVLDTLGRGESVYVHCFAGHGRTGTAVLTLMMLCGEDPKRALGEVKHHVGGPERATQVDFALSFATT